MLKACLLLFLCSCCVGDDTGKHDGPLSPDNFPYHVKLDDNYDLKWNFNSSHILLHAHVKTNGYIGLGISDHGAMFPSDVIIAWVKDGQVHFADRHATGQFLPAKDPQQDWHLISGQEQNDYTSITTIRKLDTCDDNDYPISAGTNKVIYSYSATDPSDDDSIPYHGITRGTRSVLLIDPPSKDRKDKALPDDVIAVEFLNNNYSVPVTDTTYSCTIKKLPPLQGKHHVVRFEPVIQKGHERLVHHIVIYFCTVPIDQKYVDSNYMCYGHQPRQFGKCWNMFLTWAIGGTGFNYPPHVGHSLGDVDDPVYFKMEIHYDNVGMRSGFVDSSGMRFYLTKQLRKYDAGTIEAGVKVTHYQIIPPHYDNFLSQGFCHKDCLAQALGDDEEIHVFSELLHTHLIGKAIRSRIIRNGTELPPLLEDMNYDFDYQEQRVFPKERTIKKGDTLITECYYDTSKKTNVTFGGLSTREEMCLSILLYYPKKPIHICTSRLRYRVPRNITHKGVFDYIKKLDFTKETDRDTFVKFTENSKIVNTCVGPPHYKWKFKMTPQPKVTYPYQPVDKCKA